MHDLAVIDQPQIMILPGVDQDAAEIGWLYRASRSSLVDSMKYAIECGRRLKIKKASCKHGEWMRWLTENEQTLGFTTDRTAQRLMRLPAENPTPASDLNEATAVTISRKLWGHDNVRGTQGTGDSEWFTPAEIITKAREVLDVIDLDPATSEQAQHTVQALQYFIKEQDGLAHDWFGNVWLNPPYAQPFIEHFADKMIAEVQACRVKAAIMQAARAITGHGTCTSLPSRTTHQWPNAAVVGLGKRYRLVIGRAAAAPSTGGCAEEPFVSHALPFVTRKHGPGIFRHARA